MLNVDCEDNFEDIYKEYTLDFWMQKPSEFKIKPLKISIILSFKAHVKRLGLNNCFLVIYSS